ncbi:MAG: 16S rRNA (guanine(527)-N(7))-methyltransferase RsmG [Gammaproteobacteria bacterium]|jgi:16S rRNA (guanine527-N7)-methyltransferase
MNTPHFSAADVRARLAGTPCASARAYAEPLAGFLSLLAKWNRVYNLTGFRDARRLLDRNLLECLSIAPWLAGTAIADVGTGAGLPGLPLAITEPGRHFTLIESRAKRVHFLRHVVGELGLENVSIEHSRAEDLPQGACFATVLARAVAAPPELLVIARHLTGPGSRVVLLTSPDTGSAYQDLPEDFALREITPAGADGEFGVVVLLERTA